MSSRRISNVLSNKNVALLLAYNLHYILGDLSTMPSIVSNPEAEALESWNLAQWNQALFVHFFVSPHPAQAINRLHVTAKSRYPGWSEWRDFTAEDLQQIDFSKLAALSRVGSLKQTLPLAQIRLRGGIRAGDSYVSMPGSLPSIEIRDADRVALHLQPQMDLDAQKSPTDGWTFPDDTDHSRLVGQNRLAAYVSSVQIAERIVSFVGDVLETRYKRPSTNGRWFVESGLSDVSIFEHEDSLVPWSLDRYSTFSFAQEIPLPHPTADHRRLNAAITKVAASLASQRGMSEREIAISLTESFGVPWFAVWPILRAWVESGLLDCLVDLRWRARFYSTVVGDRY